MLVRAATVREPLYTEQDRAELLALAEHRAELCPACGGLLSECTSHEAGGPSFRAKAVLCRRREHLLMAQAARGGEHPEAWVWSMTTVPPKRRPRR